MNIAITGAGELDSIGFQIADRLRKGGHDVGVIDIAGKHDYSADLRYVEAEGGYRLHAFDVLSGLMDAKKWESIEVLINCAGVTAMEEIQHLEAYQWHHVMAVNLHAPFFLCQSFMDEHFGDTKTVVNIASMGYKMPLRHSVAYTTSKAGLVMMTRSFAKDYADTGHRFFTVAPGSVEGSGMIRQVINEMVRLRSMTKDSAARYIKHGTPSGRMMTKGEVADQVIWCVDSAPEYMSGAIIESPGGM